MAIDQALVDVGKCGAKLRGGRPGHCKRGAGDQTSHVGTGRCKYHGGADGSGRPPTHGRYSKAKIKSERLQELIDQFSDDEDPLNLLPEIALLRALIFDYIERYEEYAPALIAWHASFSKEYRAAERTAIENEQDPPDPAGYGKPAQVADVLSVGQFITSLGSLVERIEKRREKGAISMVTMIGILEAHGVELVAAVRETVNDPDLQAAIVGAVEQRWANIPVPAGAIGTK